MSFWVRLSQMVRKRPGHWAFGSVWVSPGQAATLARVSLSKRSAPLWLNVILTTQVVPLGSMLAEAFEMLSPVSPVNAGLYPGSGPPVTFASGTHFVYTSLLTAPIVFCASSAV